jgi:hypothetical protein
MGIMHVSALCWRLLETVMEVYDLPLERLDGDVKKPAERQRIVDRFNRDPRKIGVSSRHAVVRRARDCACALFCIS